MTTVSLKMPEEQIKHIKRMSHHLSIERDQDLTFSDLVREALNKAFPIPKDKNQKHND